MALGGGIHMLRIAPAVFILLLIARPVFAAPSFDCAKAAEISEKIICGNDELAALDVELSKLYSARLSELDSFGNAALRKDEKAWIDHRMRFCAPPLVKDDIESRTLCILRSYRQRVAAMRGTCEVDNDHSLEEIADMKQPWSIKLPKGFSTKPDVQIYRNSDNVTNFNLPSTSLPSARRAAWGMRCCSGGWLMTCKVTAPDGTEWLVQNSGESLSYAPTTNLEPASAYDERAARQDRERKERYERELQNRSQITPSPSSPASAH